MESRKAGKSSDPYIRYLVGRSWQCAESPSGAHHWVFDEKDNKFHCKYCGLSKRLPLSWQEWQNKNIRAAGGPPYSHPLAEDYPSRGMRDSG